MIQQVPLAHAPYALVPHTAFGAIWMTWTESGKPELIRFDTRFGRVAARIALPPARERRQHAGRGRGRHA